MIYKYPLILIIDDYSNIDIDVLFMWINKYTMNVDDSMEIYCPIFSCG